MLKRVPTVKTSYNLSQLIKGLVDGWFKKFGEIPKKESIGVLYAQNALETGGTVSMWNNNIGNVKAVDNPNSVVEYCVLNNVWEIINGKKVILSPEDPGSWFRSFPTLGDGIAHHMDFLKNKRYAKAWTAVETGDPVLFAHLLKVAGYYTAPEADYVKLMKYYFNKFLADKNFEQAIAGLVVPQPEPIPTEDQTPKPEPVPTPVPVPEPLPEPKVEENPLPEPPVKEVKSLTEKILEIVFPSLIWIKKYFEKK